MPCGKGAFTYDVSSRGGGCLEMLRLLTGCEKLHKFWSKFMFQINLLKIKLCKFPYINILILKGGGGGGGGGSP